MRGDWGERGSACLLPGAARSVFGRLTWHWYSALAIGQGFHGLDFGNWRIGFGKPESDDWPLGLVGVISVIGLWDFVHLILQKGL